MAVILLRRACHAWVGTSPTRTLADDVDVLIDDGTIQAIGRDLPAPPHARRIDASRWLVMPGFVNAHHHLSQQLSRTRATGAGVLNWLAECYPLWHRLDAAAAHVATQAAMTELVLTGVTATADLSYYFPCGTEDAADAQITAARSVGPRLLFARGTLRTVGAEVVARIGNEFEADIEAPRDYLRELQRLHETYNDGTHRGRVRIAAGVTEPLWNDRAFMRDIAMVAQDREMRLHTHLHPRPEDLAATGGDPVAALRDLGWWGPHMWVAHGTRLHDDTLRAMADEGVALSTSPSSNARLGSPIAPAARLDRMGGVVAIGVDGGASNDSGDFVGECRLAWQMQRTRDPELMAGPTRVLDWATTGGARALGWDGLGELVVGGQADIACFDLHRLDRAGTSDPLAALVLTGLSHRADCVLVDGRVVVEDGRPVLIDEARLVDAIAEHVTRLERISGSES